MNLPDGQALEIPVGKRQTGGESTQRWRFGHSFCGHPVSILDQFQDTWSNIIFPSLEKDCIAPHVQSDTHSLGHPIGASHL